jgi:predicted DNA-binding protein (UPF0251 family)
MQTVTVELRNEHALRLLQDLEKMDVIRLVDVAGKQPDNASRFRGTISKSTADDLHRQLQSIREEWPKDI